MRPTAVLLALVRSFAPHLRRSFAAQVLLASAASATLITGRCSEQEHTLCPSVANATDFCCPPEAQCWRTAVTVNGIKYPSVGGCIYPGGVGCDDGHTCPPGTECCGSKCMPAGSACCGGGLAYCPNGYPCSAENPYKCGSSLLAISPLLIFALLAYLLL